MDVRVMGHTEHAKHAVGDSPNVDFICGWCAGCAETCILFPLSKMTFRQQLHGVMLKDAVSQLFTEGIPNLYRGLLPPLIQRTSTRMVMFGMFDTYRRLLGCATNNTFTFCFATSALLAGSTEALLCPLERLQVVLQTSAYHSHFRNTGEAFRFIMPYGIPEFYRGFSLIVIRNSFSNVLYFTLRDPLKQFLIDSFKSSPSETNVSRQNSEGNQETANEVVSPLLLHSSNFVSGALLGAAISTLFFPEDRQRKIVFGFIYADNPSKSHHSMKIDLISTYYFIVKCSQASDAICYWQRFHIGVQGILNGLEGAKLFGERTLSWCSPQLHKVIDYMGDYEQRLRVLEVFF